MAAMVAAVAAVAVVASWDAEREAVRALGDFAAEQATLARALGAVVRLSAGADARRVLGELNAVPRPADTVVLVRRVGAAHFLGSDGREVEAPPVAEAFARGETVARLSRPEAAQLGLPTRTAWAGLARVDTAGSGSWEIAAIASAQRQRDRERAAARRLVGSVSVAAVLVLAFGGLAMRRQRRELLLERELAVAALQERGDERLQRASRMAALGTLAIGVAHEIATPLGVIAGRAEQLRPPGRRRPDPEGAAGDPRPGQADRRGDPRAARPRARRRAGGRSGGAPRGGRGRRGAGRASLPEGRRAADAGGGARAPGDQRGRAPHRARAGQPAAQRLRRLPRRGRGGRARFARHDPPRRQIVFTVADTGAGISEADLCRVVEPFFTTKPVGEGTGLGLAIAREIVSSHRGELALAPGPSGGTVVTVWLPAAAEAAAGKENLG